MAFDFPSNPTVGDIHTEAGVEYQYDGNSVWNLVGGGAMSDYVLKAGDTMTGPLTVQASPTNGGIALRLPNGGEPGHIAWLNGDGTRKAWLGAGSGINLTLNLDAAETLEVLGGNVLLSAGNLGFTNFAQPAGSEHLLTRHINMYGGTFGFSISSGTLNHVVPASNIHAFLCGTEKVVDIRSDGMRIPGGNLNVTGSITGTSVHANGNISIRDNDSFDLSNGYYIRKVSGVQNMFFHGGQSNAYFTFHITGFGDAFVIDKVGSTGNSVNVTAPEALALASELGVAADPERGVDLVKMLAAALLRIKQLESR